MNRKNVLEPILGEEVFEVQGEVERYPGEGGWYFVRVPRKYTEVTKDLADRGLVAIVA